jgi:uncharacterized membrane protein
MKSFIKNKKCLYNTAEIGLASIFFIGVIFLAGLSQSIWFDEVFSLALVKHSLKEMISLIIADVHPPLYYLILKIATVLFGESIFVAKLVSALPSILTLVFSAFFLKKNFSDRAVILFLLCFMASQHIVTYSIEIRMYSWALFFVTMTAITAWHVVSTGKKIWWGMFLLCMECAAYTHYYAGMAVGIEYLLLLGYIIRYDRKKILQVLFLAVLALLFYLPWISIAIQQFAKVSECIEVIFLINIRNIRSSFFRFFAVGDLWHKYFSFINPLTVLFAVLFCIVFCFFLITNLMCICKA